MHLAFHYLKLILSQFLGENYWKNPEKFDPNRFFDTNGKLNIPEAFIPFGLGMFLIILRSSVKFMSQTLVDTRLTLDLANVKYLTQ